MIDPDIQSFVHESERVSATGAPLSVAEQRRRYESYAQACSVRRPAAVESQDGVLVLEDRAVRLRRYTPAGGGRGLVLYAHGGGFVLGSLDSHDGIVARVAQQTGAEAVAIDYRLAPEHPAPAALDDVLAIIAAAFEGRLPWPDLPRSGLSLMGDSAGGTLMASAALVCGRRPGTLAGLALVYPMLGFEPAEPARSQQAEAPMLTLAEVRAYRDSYLAGAEPPPGTFILDEPDLEGLPPTVLLPAEHDPLRDDCTELARRLRLAGRSVVLLPGTGLVHGCLRALDRSAAVAEPFAHLCAVLAERMQGSTTRLSDVASVTCSA